MTFALLRLIEEAAMELGSEACRNGQHDWLAEGGRRCPHASDDPADDGCGGSQTVYRCQTCGAYDYGGAGGPGALDCATHCPPVRKGA